MDLRMSALQLPKLWLTMLALVRNSRHRDVRPILFPSRERFLVDTLGSRRRGRTTMPAPQRKEQRQTR
jgi:hypothetical protein